jgi:hypothetical protein
MTKLRATVNNAAQRSGAAGATFDIPCQPSHAGSQNIEVAWWNLWDQKHMQIYAQRIAPWAGEVLKGVSPTHAYAYEISGT